ncbi:DUF6207 family protein [Streptomyces albogriseolus]|uniref:DUF6207 family protein n=1 Tax=Streptomyces albogriseolus TaxID=1887 RepID=UPI0033AA8A88
MAARADIAASSACRILSGGQLAARWATAAADRAIQAPSESGVQLHRYLDRRQAALFLTWSPLWTARPSS